MSAPGLVGASASTFSLKQRIVLAVVPPALAWCVRALHVGCTVEVRGQEHWDDVAGREDHFLMGFWHESIAMAGWYFRDRGYCSLTSLSFDGELAARVIRRLGSKALRGSSSRGGLQAISELTKAADAVPVLAFTLDGPRGPRRLAKPGIAIVAAKTGLPIIPVAFACEKARRLKTWDRMSIARPLAKITCAYAPPIPPPLGATREDIEKTRLRVETELNGLHDAIDGSLAPA